MNPEELMEKFPDIDEFVIDVHENTEEGTFAFLAVVPATNGEMSVWPFAYVGALPPNPEGKIVGFICEDEAFGNEWIEKNRPYLEKLNIERADALGTL